jgi:hypothetical protein
MKTTFGLVFALILATTPVDAQKITLDIAHDFDFASVETFNVAAAAPGGAIDEVTESRLRYAVIRELAHAGLRSVSADPDLVVTYLVTTEQAAVVDHPELGANGVHGGWAAWRGGAPAASPASAVFAGGMLVVDAFDPAAQMMVWRAVGVVGADLDPEKRRRRIDKLLDTLGKRWAKILHRVRPSEAAGARDEVE